MTHWFMFVFFFFLSHAERPVASSTAHRAKWSQRFLSDRRKWHIIIYGDNYPLRCVCVYVWPQAEAGNTPENTASVAQERRGANQATRLSNAKPLVFYLGLNYSTGEQPPPLRREQILDSTLLFDRGIAERQYISPERLFWDQEPAVPLMTSSISFWLPETWLGWFTIYSHLFVLSCSQLCGLLRPSRRTGGYPAVAHWSPRRTLCLAWFDVHLIPRCTSSQSLCV